MRTPVVVGSALCVTVVGAIAIVHPWSASHAQVHEHVREPEHGPRRDAPRAGRTWSAAELAVHDRVALEESRKIERRARERRAGGKDAKAAGVPGMSWVSLGPTDALHNDSGIDSVDSGRLNSIVPDPRDPDVVYVAAAGGGVWKTFDFLSPSGPTWHPITDTAPNLSTGALAMDPTAPDTLYFAAGDFADRNPPGNTVQKSTDGGVTWSSPVVLHCVYPPPNGRVANVMSVRSLAADGNVVVAATDVGLFVSHDAGASFALADLPHPSGQRLAFAMWSVVDVGGGHWLATGVSACDEHAAPPRPRPRGVDPGAACAQGNNGVIWRSDDGVTWTVVAAPTITGVGRIMLAAGSTAQPAKTPVYAFVAATNGRSTLGFWRSLDGGVTWKDATGTLTNPSKPYTYEGDVYQDCPSVDIGEYQSWYNELIAVDPSNPDHVLIGGNLCGARTLDGTSDAPHWELVAHWAPIDDSGATDNGRLPYVHADWHAAAFAVFGGKVRAFAGTDGGLFSSTNLFDAATPAEKVVWTHHNRGLATHLLYSVASGDPVHGNPFLLYTGLQDNGTRYRTDPAHPAAFDEVIGGDGVGATVHSGARTTYWASVEYGRLYCQPSKDVDCGDPKGWSFLSPAGVAPAPGEDDLDEDEARAVRRVSRGGAARRSPAADEDPFLIRYADVETDTTGDSVLTHSDEQVFVSEASPPGATEAFTWKSIALPGPSGTRYYSNVFASRTVPGLYGAAGATGDFPFYVTTSGNTPAIWTEARPVIPAGASVPLDRPWGMDFPPVTPPGAQPGQVFIGSFLGPLMDADHTPPPDDQGYLYRTRDGGQTWASIIGADPAHRLPNVGINVVKYDPVTPTTIYAGTDLGMYISLDDGATWDRMGEGFPMVTVHDIYVARNQDFIRVATFGRGMWEIYPSASENHGATGDGDYDRNQRIDWVDLGAMASRLGVTPATATAPRYSWLMDLASTGDGAPVQAIGDDDLAALLAKFGGHP
jgi:photosystem II stability/assembly factor-like uncharacterized protein